MTHLVARRIRACEEDVSLSYELMGHYGRLGLRVPREPDRIDRFDTATVDGFVDRRFRCVLDQFCENIQTGQEVGASLCVIDDGEVVVDLWGGRVRRGCGRQWRADTVCPIFSATKGIVAFCFLILHDRKLIEYDEDVKKYWLDFPVDGVTVDALLNHRSGLIGLDRDVRLDELACRETTKRVLERQRPIWQSGSTQGYHGVTWGLFATELFRMVSGRSIGHFLAEEVARPLGLRMWIGLPEGEHENVATIHPIRRHEFLTDLLPRCLVDTEEGRVVRAYLLDSCSPTRLAFRYPSELGSRGIRNFNLPEVQSLELGWAGGITTARDLATLYQIVASDGYVGKYRLMGPCASRLPAIKKRLDYDAVLKRRMTWELGFAKEDPEVFSTSESSFGHCGVGGAMGWCDPEKRRSIGYIPNQMDTRIRSRRARSLCKAIASVPSRYTEIDAS